MDKSAWISIIGILISSLCAYAASRAASNASVKNTEVSSRTDIETEAFGRAKGFYTDVIDRQATRIGDLETQVEELMPYKDKYDELENKFDVMKDNYELLETQHELLKAEVAAMKSKNQGGKPNEYGL